MRKFYLLTLLVIPSLFGEPIVISDDTDDSEAEIAKYSEEELLQKVFGQGRKQKEVIMQFNVTLDGEKVGQAFVIAGKDKKIFARNLKDVLGDYLVEGEVEQIDKIVDKDGFVSFSKLGFLQLKTEFNLETLDVAITVPISKKKRRNLSGHTEEDYRRKVTVKPAFISAMMNTRASQTISTYGGKSSSNGNTSKSTVIDISPAINVGGVVLEGAGTFNKSNSDEKMKFHRDYLSVVYDFLDSPMRLRAGDIFGTSQSYYSVPRLWGIGFRKDAKTSSASNCSSNLQLTVLRESKIEIFVNDALIRTKEHVAPGTYYLDDVPYAYGYNDVKIKLTDNSGKEEIIDASSYLDGSIVAPGEFSLDCNFGYPEADHENKSKGRYDKDRKTISLGVRYGLPYATDILVGGVKTKFGHTGTVELRNSNILGFFTVRYGLSKYGKKLRGKAYSLNYSSPSIKLFGEASLSFGTSYDKTEDFFYSYLDEPTGKKYDFDDDEKEDNFGERRHDGLLEKRRNYNGKTTNNSYHAYLSNIFGVSFSFGYSVRHRQNETEKRRSFSMSKTFQLDNNIFNSMSLYFSHDRTDYSDRKSSKGFSLSCSLSFKNNGSLSSGYSKHDDNASEYVSYSNDCLDHSVYYHLQDSHYKDGNDISGDVSYYHSKFKADASHRRSSNQSKTTRFGLETNWYFADGHFGISKNSAYDGGFVIITSGGEISDTPIKMENGEESGLLGGVVVSSSHHSLSTNRIDIKNLPDNIELKEDSVTSYGEYKRGAVKEITVDGTYIAKGRLLDHHGKPFELVSGFASYIGDKNIEPVAFFTNASGKFILSNLKTGKYRISVSVEGCDDFEIDVKPCKDKILDLGTITCEGTYEDI